MLDLNKIIIDIVLQVDPHGRQILLHLLLVLIVLMEFHLTPKILLLVQRRLRLCTAEPVGIIGFILQMLLQLAALGQRILQDVALGLETFTLQVDAAVHNLLLLSKEFLC